MSELLNHNQKVTNVNLEINNVLTTNTCAKVIIEVIKYLAYQKQQIPYNYERLKYVVNKKRENNIDSEKDRESWASQKYFNLTSTAVDSLEDIFKNIIFEFEKQNIPDEICIIFGTNIISAKEVYRIIIPGSINIHHYNNHNVGTQNLIRKILRTLIFLKEMQTVVGEPLSPMNMYVLLKQRNKSKAAYDESAFFMTMDRLCISKRTPQIIINLDYNPLHAECCDQIRIFNDSTSSAVNNSFNVDDKSREWNLNNQNIAAIDSTNDIECWFQAEKYLKGFKANFINGHSVSDLWIR